MVKAVEGGQEMKKLLLALLLLAAFGVSPEASAGALPLCKDQWKGQPYAYDFQEEYGAFQRRLQRTECEKEWTVLVYMAADNELFPFALWDLYEMEAAYKNKNVAASSLKADLIVQVDGPANDDLRRLHIFSGPEEYREHTKDDFIAAKLDSVKSPVIERLSESNRQTEQQRLENFLTWAVEKYPSRNYMLVVWGHGQGWKSYPVTDPAKSRFLDPPGLPEFPKPASDPAFGGIAFHQSSGTWLDIPALSRALKKFQNAVGKSLDVYASDACLMQMLEVSYELAENARFVVGSTQVQSFLGLPYRRLMYELNTGHFNGLRKDNRPNIDGGDEPYLLAKMIPTLMKQSLNPRGHGLHSGLEAEAIKSITSSALTSAEFQGQLIPEITRLSQALKAYLLEDKARILDLRFVTQNVPALEGSAQDFGIFLGFLDQLIQKERAKSSNAELSPAAAQLREAVTRTKQALDRSVLAFAYGSAYGVDDASQLIGYVPRAVSLWLPVAVAEFRKRKDEFMASRFYKATHWQAWLEILFP